MNDPQIAHYLSQNKIPSKRNKTDWAGKDVWSLRKKFLDRENRSNHQTFRFLQIKLITPRHTFEVNEKQIYKSATYGKNKA